VELSWNSPVLHRIESSHRKIENRQFTEECSCEGVVALGRSDPGLELLKPNLLPLAWNPNAGGITPGDRILHHTPKPACRLGSTPTRYIRTKDDPEVRASKVEAVAFGDDLDGLAVHHYIFFFDFDPSVKGSVHRVVLEQVGVGRRVAEIVDGDELQAVLLSALVMGAQDVAPDAPEPVDGNLDHPLILLACS